MTLHLNAIFLAIVVVVVAVTVFFLVILQYVHHVRIQRARKAMYAYNEAVNQYHADNESPESSVAACIKRKHLSGSPPSFKSSTQVPACRSTLKGNHYDTTTVTTTVHNSSFD